MFSWSALGTLFWKIVWEFRLKLSWKTRLAWKNIGRFPWNNVGDYFCTLFRGIFCKQLFQQKTFWGMRLQMTLRKPFLRSILGNRLGLLGNPLDNRIWKPSWTTRLGNFFGPCARKLSWTNIFENSSGKVLEKSFENMYRKKMAESSLNCFGRFSWHYLVTNFIGTSG